MKDRGLALLLFGILVAADLAAWFKIFSGAPTSGAAISFLDVGQGDASLLELASGARIMTDAGPNSSVLSALDNILSGRGKYIDLAIITHPDLDHFNGFNHILDSYDIGAFAGSGRANQDSRQWAEFVAKANAKNIPIITLAEGDIIRQGPNRIDILSPGPQLVGSPGLNDTSIVQKVRTPDFSVLLAADIGTNIEDRLRARYDLAADILKVGHHGSKFSSGSAFLKEVSPVVAVISSGRGNTYGHPTPDVLNRLSALHIPVLRTDQRGTLLLRRQNGELGVRTEK